MKSTKLIFNSLLMASLLFVYSCGSNTDAPANEEVTVVATEVNETNLLLDFIDAEKNPMTATAEEGGFPRFMSAQEVNDELGGYIAILDLRGGEDFAKGHIEGALNIKPTDLANFVAEDFDQDAYDKIVLVCYSGQIASYEAGLLSLMGVKNVYVMKWGMSSWNKKFSYKWEDAIGDNKDITLETTENPMAAAGELPSKISTGKTDGAEIATAQASALLGEGFTPARIKMADIDDMSKYYIISVQTKAEYDAGHLPGAIWYNAKEAFGKDQKLNTLPTDKPILVYCNSGQNAAFAIAYLRMLGYDAVSLLYGANGFMHSALKNNGGPAFSKDMVADFEYVESEFQGAAGSGGGGC